MEEGKISDDLDAPNLIAADLFGWWVDDDLLTDKSLVKSVRDILEAMDELAWARVANAGGIAVDLLRGLYQEVVPPELRKSLGEFFTPRYLAERVIAKTEELADLPEPSQPRVLDPSCGSGTFLVAAIRRGLMRLAALGLADDVDSLDTLINSVVGFDINPVAPIMTKVNLLLSLGDRAASLPQIDFKVYQADSILLPRLETGQAMLGGPAIPYEVLPLEIGDIELPQSLATLEGVKVLRDNVDVALQNNRSPKQFGLRLKVDVAKLPGITNVDDVVNMCTVIYTRIVNLKKHKQDGVWSHVIEQSYAPKALKPVDIVVGNPPWISWKNLPDRWKTRSETTWRQWGLWQTSGRSVPLSDISTLLFARSIATYAPDAVVGMLLPRSVLIADPGGRKIRQCKLAGSGRPDSVVHFRPIFVDDFSAIRPFSPDAANEPVALYAHSGDAVKGKLHVPADVWSRRHARTRIDPTSSWRRASEEALLGERTALEPIDSSDIASPWAPAPQSGEVTLLKAGQPVSYHWGRGFETRGVDGILFVEVVSGDVSPGSQPPKLVRVTTHPELGRNTAALPAVTRPAEPGLLWPLIKGRDVQPWRWNSWLHVIVAHDPMDLRKVLTVPQLMQAAPKLYDNFLEPHMKRLEERSLYRPGQKSNDEGPWGLSGPVEYLSSTKYIVLVRYIASGGRPAAAVVASTFDPKTGRSTTPVPNNKTNIYYTASKDEAYYLAGWINSAPVQDALQRFSAATGITPRALERLPIPAYVSTNEDHRRVVDESLACTRAAADGDNARLASHWQAVDTAIAKIAGVDAAALTIRSQEEVAAELEPPTDDD